MKTRQEILDKITALKNNIEQGKKFEEQGYDCGMMLCFTYSLLNKALEELDSFDKPKNRPLAGAFY